MPPTPGVDRPSRKRQRTRDEILEAARWLFALHGFAATSVTRIAGAADVAEATVYNHFPRKEDLFFHGRCPWAQITDHLADNPEDHTTGPELIGVVRDAALTVAEASTLIADRRRSVMDWPGDTAPVTAHSAAALLHGRLLELHDLVVDQVDRPLASH